MKTLINTSMGLLITVVGASILYWIFSNTSNALLQTPSTKSISVLFDVTDTSFTQPNMDEILGTTEFQEVNSTTMWNGINIRVSSLSDMDLNKVKMVALPPQNRWLSNEFERAKEILKFKEIATKLLVDSNEALGRNQSSIIWPITQELIRLSQDSAEEKVLIIYSDLMENTNGLTLYKTTQYREFLNKGDSENILTESLENVALDGITIYLIYEPKDTSENDRYMKVSTVFKSFFEGCGATVNRSANLIQK